MNRVVLIGNLTKDVELTTTPNGVSVARFTLAVQRDFSNADGERECDFINCVAWRTLAENVNTYLGKGKKCGVVGRIQTRTYDAQDGTKRYVTEILAEQVEFLSPVDKNSKEDTPVLTPVEDNDLPF